MRRWQREPRGGQRQRLKREAIKRVSSRFVTARRVSHDFRIQGKWIRHPIRTALVRPQHAGGNRETYPWKGREVSPACTRRCCRKRRHHLAVEGHREGWQCAPSRHLGTPIF